MKKPFTQEDIIGFLKEAVAGASVQELCIKYGFSELSYNQWKSQFECMDDPESRRVKALEEENGCLKKMLAEAILDKEALKEIIAKK